MNQKLHIPSGSMCIGCEHIYRKCNHLDFTAMHVIEKAPDVNVVKCTAYTRAGSAKQVRPQTMHQEIEMTAPRLPKERLTMGRCLGFLFFATCCMAFSFAVLGV